MSKSAENSEKTEIIVNDPHYIENNGEVIGLPIYGFTFTEEELKTLPAVKTNLQLNIDYNRCMWGLDISLQGLNLLEEERKKEEKPSVSNSIYNTMVIQKLKQEIAFYTQEVEKFKKVVEDYYPVKEDALYKEFLAYAGSITMQDIIDVVLTEESEEVKSKLLNGTIKMEVDELLSIYSSAVFLYYEKAQALNYDLSRYYMAFYSFAMDNMGYTYEEIEDFYKATDRQDIIDDILKPLKEKRSVKVEDTQELNLQLFNNGKAATNVIAPLITKPLLYSALNSKVSNHLAGITDRLYNEQNDGQISFSFVPITAKEDQDGAVIVDVGGKKTVPVLVSLSYDGELSFNKAKIKPFDENVLNTVCSILQAGNTKMTLYDIAKTMHGNSTKKVTQKELDKINASMRKLAATRVYMDITNEANARYAFENDPVFASLKVDQSLLSYTGIEAKLKTGQQVYLIELDREPILYRYCKLKNELVSYDTKLLAIPINETEDITLLKFYLIKQVQLINKGELRNRIKYETVFEKTGVEEGKTKQARQRNRDYIKRMFEFWKQEGFIKDFKEYKEGREIKGIEIIPNIAK